MKKGKVTIKNYRAVTLDAPITIEINEGITFILGVNNIGKSNLLKFFYEFRSLISGNVYNYKFSEGNPSIVGGNNYNSVKNQNSASNNILISLETDNQIIDIKITPHGENLNFSNYELKPQIKNKLNKSYEDNDYDIFYQIFRNSLYIVSFRTPIFASSANYFDIRIGEGFIKDWDTWANGPDIEKRRKIRELKTELKDLFQFNHFEISLNSSNNNLIVETDDGSFLLNELGGGIGHFILVLGNCLMKEPGFILIDEPENALHPKLQEVFIRTLASKAKYGVIATSHSIGLARSTADKIYSLSKNDAGHLKLVDYGESYHSSISNSISELGFSQFFELGGKNILLVEGRTDIKCFKEILRKYKIEQHFIIMDLGGSNFINRESYEELEELKRLNANSYSVIFDSEYSKENDELQDKFKAFRQTCDNLGFNTFVTECHSTDNYITQEAINIIIGENFPKLDKFESLESSERKANGTKWGKSLNWKMFREMNKDDFKDTELDKFITETLIPLTKENSHQ